MRAHWKPRVAVRFVCFSFGNVKVGDDAALRDATHEGSPCRENQLNAQPHRLRQRRWSVGFLTLLDHWPLPPWGVSSVWFSKPHERKNIWNCASNPKQRFQWKDKYCPSTVYLFILVKVGSLAIWGSRHAKNGTLINNAQVNHG